MAEAIKAEAVKRAVVLNEPRMKMAEYERNTWIVNADEGTSVTDVLEPAYWAYVSDKLRPYDIVEVRVDSGEWMLELLVLGCDRNWARVFVKQKYDLQPFETEMPAAQKHKVEWKGPQLKFCVIRISDSEIIFKGLDKQEAYSQMTRHERVTA